MTHNNQEERSVEDWEKRFDEVYPPVTIGYDGDERDYFRREWTRELIEKTLHHQLQKAREEAYKNGARDVRDFAQVEIMKRASQLRDDITTFTSETIHSELDPLPTQVTE